MAVARIEPVRAHRFEPAVLRGKPVERRVRTPRRSLVAGAILAGGLLQHVLASTPIEPQPTPLAAVMSTGVLTMARPVGAAAGHGPVVHTAAPRHHAAARPAAALPTHPARQLRPGHALRTVRMRPLTSTGAAALRRPTASRRIAALLPPVGSIGDALRVAMAPNPQGAILHVPSVSVAAIRAALRAAGSPALDAAYANGKDAAEYIWDSGRVLGVDPAVVMAIFDHESSFGTRGMARLTDSVGNIRPLAGQPALGGYRLYRSWEEGFDDCYRLLLSYARHGATTIPVAIPVWAPPSDNNDDGAYIASVLGTMGDLYAASKP